MNDRVKDRMQALGPKKILACDGGGVLGLMSVKILAKLETDLRAQRGKPVRVLADSFDFVCNTSTGANVATCISAGMSMDQIRAFYVGSGAQVFDEIHPGHPAWRTELCGDACRHRAPEGACLMPTCFVVRHLWSSWDHAVPPDPAALTKHV